MKRGLRIVLMVASASILLAADECSIGFLQTPFNVDCDEIKLALRPGECVAFANQCGDERPSFKHASGRTVVLERDSVRLGFSLRLVSGPREELASLCRKVSTGDELPPFVRLNYRYFDSSDRPTREGDGVIQVATDDSFRISAIASPTQVEDGGETRLDAVLVGGIPPYRYRWEEEIIGQAQSSGSSTLSSARFKSTAARELDVVGAGQPTRYAYTLTAVDAFGLAATDRVIVEAGFSVRPTASRTSIQPGERVQLTANPAHAAGPVSFRWSPDHPDAGLSDPLAENPVATPTRTLLYSVSATDTATGRTHADADGVYVMVDMASNLSASPATLAPGGSSQLRAAVAGGAPPFVYEWSPARFLDDRRRDDPLATPPFTTRFTLEVADFRGNVVTDQITVAVPGAVDSFDGAYAVGFPSCLSAVCPLVPGLGSSPGIDVLFDPLLGTVQLAPAAGSSFVAVAGDYVEAGPIVSFDGLTGTGVLSGVPVTVVADGTLQIDDRGASVLDLTYTIQGPSSTEVVGLLGAR